jgi:hypothetical protein
MHARNPALPLRASRSHHLGRAVPGPASPANADWAARRMRLERLEWLAHLLDTAVTIPGTRIRFGLDGLFGLLPGIGDAITTAISFWIIYEARQLGAPLHLVVRMIGNVTIDGTFGAVTVLGDAFDVMWKANRRNVALLRDHLLRDPLARPGTA